MQQYPPAVVKVSKLFFTTVCVQVAVRVTPTPKTAPMRVSAERRVIEQETRDDTFVNSNSTEIPSPIASITYGF